MPIGKCLIILLFFLCSESWGQKFFVTTYHTVHGLPSQKIRMTTKDSLGFLWIATDAGLVRFDGKQFYSYSARLESKYIKALSKGPDDRIYLANDTGVHAVSVETDTAYIQSFITATSLKNDTLINYPNNLFWDQQKRLWLSQPNGSIVLSDAGILKHFPFDKSHKNGFSHSQFSFAQDTFGTVWVAATTGQVYAFDEASQRFQQVHLPFKIQEIKDLKISDEQLWIAGNTLINAKITSSKSLKQINQYQTNGLILTCIQPTFDPSEIYLGSKENGFFKGQIRNKELLIQPIFGANDPHRVEELPFQNIHQIFQDSEGSIWLSTAQGLGLLQSRFFEGVFGLANSNTYVIHSLPSNEVFLSFGDVYEISQDNDNYFGNLLPSLDRGFITGLTHTKTGLWMATANGEVFNYRNNFIYNLQNLSNRGGGIFFIAGDRQNNIWICQAPTANPIVGVVKLSPDQKLHYYQEEKGLENRILVLRESNRGILYAAGIGPETYLYRYQAQTDEFINLSSPLSFNYSQNFEVHDMTIDPSGIVWMGTTDGLLKYDLERIQRVDLGEWTSTEIRSVVSMENNDIWLSTDTKGLIFYSKGQAVHFDEESGLPSKITAYRTLSKDNTGRIWVGTAEGAVYSRMPNPKPKQTIKPTLLFFKAFGKAKKINRRPLSLSNKANIEVRFVSLAFPGKNIQYQYRLKGHIDTSWTTPSQEGHLSYHKLPQGRYQLEIRAKQIGGFTWSSPLIISFNVRQVWYKTWWGISLLVLILLGLLYHLFKLNIGRLLDRIQFLEKALAVQKAENTQQTTPTNAQSTSQEVFPYITLLHQVLDQIPYLNSWPNTLQVLQTLLEPPYYFAAFELGFFANGKVQLVGTSRQGRINRQEPFDEKVSLAAQCLRHKQSLISFDFKNEYTDHIHNTSITSYQSIIIIPFELPGIQQLVLVVYSIDGIGFQKQDQQMLALIAKHLSTNIRARLEE